MCRLAGIYSQVKSFLHSRISTGLTPMNLLYSISEKWISMLLQFMILYQNITGTRLVNSSCTWDHFNDNIVYLSLLFFKQLMRQSLFNFCNMYLNITDTRLVNSFCTWDHLNDILYLPLLFLSRLWDSSFCNFYNKNWTIRNSLRLNLKIN